MASGGPLPARTVHRENVSGDHRAPQGCRPGPLRPGLLRSRARHRLRDHPTPFDQVAEEVEAHLESEQVRRCLETLTELQRQAVTLAYHQGLTYRAVAERLGSPLANVKTRMRDALIRLRDCMGAGE
ncbi:sigma factor-like helix-turn-helix DNA-binding protein [Streptomyces sp. NPDC001586]|uniref:sigma factor-like helix-turn-helix DNA-binding protein n=1 Tax=Streptomyces sp. NPDC001586 TaxID=3154387 RepID=UPI003320667E